MIDPLTINPLSLPYVALESCHQLPESPCIYFAIDSKGVVQYIGRSINPKQRWTQHHRYKRLATLNGVRIAYLSVDADLMADVERALIVWFNPPLNNLGAQCKPDTLANDGSGIKVHRRITQTIDIPDLSEKVRQAQEESGLSVSEVCRRIRISRTYWYKLVNDELSEGLAEPTLRKIEEVLGVDFGVSFNDRDSASALAELRTLTPGGTP